MLLPKPETESLGGEGPAEAEPSINILSSPIKREGSHRWSPHCASAFWIPELGDKRRRGDPGGKQKTWFPQPRIRERG